MNAPDSFCFYVMINIENISISFGNLTLFRGLDLQVHYGESVCICGGSGSGKSSLLKAVLGFVPFNTCEGAFLYFCFYLLVFL